LISGREPLFGRIKLEEIKQTLIKLSQTITEKEK